MARKKEVERECQNRFDSSTRWIIQQRCGHDCADAGIQKSLTERARFRHAHAHFFHQPRRT